MSSLSSSNHLQTCSRPQNDCLNLSFLKDIYVDGIKLARNGLKTAIRVGALDGFSIQKLSSCWNLSCTLQLSMFFSHLYNLQIQIQSKLHHNNKQMFRYDKTLDHYNDYHPHIWILWNNYQIRHLHYNMAFTSLKLLTRAINLLIPSRIAGTCSVVANASIITIIIVCTWKNCGRKKVNWEMEFL